MGWQRLDLADLANSSTVAEFIVGTQLLTRRVNRLTQVLRPSL